MQLTLSQVRYCLTDCAKDQQAIVDCLDAGVTPDIIPVWKSLRIRHLALEYALLWLICQQEGQTVDLTRFNNAATVTFDLRGY